MTSVCRHRCRWLGRIVLAAALTLLTLRGVLIQGWLRPVRIAGGSMADAFWGPHIPVTCRECGLPFRCGTEHPPTADLATCPNCGCGDTLADTAQTTLGQRVLIDRGAKRLYGLHTWQAVAFATPYERDQLTVKRLVAGGPGRVAIRDGDVYVDGRIQQKTLAQLRDLRIRVHDDQYRSPLGNRWQPAQPPSRWQPTSSGYVAQPTSEPHAHIDWLHYTQWTCWPHGAPDVDRTQTVPILDHDPYNQSLSRGNLHPVPDLLLSCQLEMSGQSRCILQLTCRADTFAWELHASSRECRLEWDGDCVAQALRPSRPPPWSVEMAVCDHRVLAAVDGVTIFEFDYSPAPVTRTVEYPRRLSIGAAGGRVRFDAPQVYRDVFYLGPNGQTRWQAPQPIASGQWFVLGDNVPVSIDSRLWSAIDEHDILGPVRPWRW